MNYYSGANRTLCDVLQELRLCFKTRNFSYTLSLVEEAQSMGNRMDAKLYDYGDIRKMQQHKDLLKKEINRLEELKYDLENRTPTADKKSGEDSAGEPRPIEF